MEKNWGGKRVMKMKVGEACAEGRSRKKAEFGFNPSEYFVKAATARLAGKVRLIFTLWSNDN